LYSAKYAASGLASARIDSMVLLRLPSETASLPVSTGMDIFSKQRINTSATSLALQLLGIKLAAGEITRISFERYIFY
jgi:hypothetical protein